MAQIVVKTILTLIIIVACAQIGRRWPSLGGLIATMPLSGLMVMLWLYTSRDSDNALMTAYAKGALFGVLPSILFFVVAYLCFKRELPLSVVLGASLGVWVAGAFIHQWLLGS